MGSGWDEGLGARAVMEKLRDSVCAWRLWATSTLALAAVFALRYGMLDSMMIYGVWC